MVLAPQGWVGHYITRGVDWDNSHSKFFTVVGAASRRIKMIHTTVFLYYFVCKTAQSLMLLNIGQDRISGNEKTIFHDVVKYDRESNSLQK
jgi:hypothetical protein